MHTLQVYLCSHTQDKNIVSAEHMAALYPGNFTYKVLPHTVYGEGTELEEELLNRCIEAFTLASLHPRVHFHYE